MLSFIIFREINELEGVFTNDPNGTQIHCCMQQLKCMGDITGLKIRKIKVSAMRWTNMKNDMSIFKKDDEKEEFYYVCYSTHSSFEELCKFIKYFAPKAIEPCVVPEVNRECFYKSLNEFCKDFLEEPCTMPVKVQSNKKRAAPSGAAAHVAAIRVLTDNFEKVTLNQ